MNSSAVAFLRVSSMRQKDNSSHETQEQEIRAYAKENALDLMQVVRLTESAKDSEKRKQYREGLKWALKNKVRHVLFYIFDRETRNLTDNESNEKLVKSGAIVLHYVKEKRIYHASSSDSDFFLRDVQAVTNKQFVRQLRTKVMDAMRTKAESGWFPGNKPPLGYMITRLKDSSGKEMKRGSIISPDSNKQNVILVRREFELRASGFSAEQIRAQIIKEGLIPLSAVPKYHRGSIERRLRNRFYYGEFEWQGVNYTGKHEKIIPSHVLDQVERSFAGKAYQRRTGAEFGLFGGGWLKCADANCRCNVVYDPKTKVIKATGEKKTFHYYHCTNGKRVHPTMAGMSVQEPSVWEQLVEAVEKITIGPDMAKQISDALNESHEIVRRERKKEIEKFRGILHDLEREEDVIYLDLKTGILSDEMYQRQLVRIRKGRREYTDLLEAANADIDGAYLQTAQSILELAKEAKSLWLSRSAHERLDFLKLVLSNQELDGVTVRYELKKPFAILSKMKEVSEWRPLVDCFRTEIDLICA